MKRHAELLAQDGGDPSDHVDRQGGCIAALRPDNHVVTDADAPRDLAEAEPACPSSVGQPHGGPVSEHPTAARTSFGGLLSDRHDRSMAVADHWRIIGRSLAAYLGRPVPRCGLSKDPPARATTSGIRRVAGAGVRHPAGGARRRQASGGRRAATSGIRRAARGDVRHPAGGGRGGSGTRRGSDLATGRSRARPRWSSRCPACGSRASPRTGGWPPPRHPRPAG